MEQLVISPAEWRVMRIAWSKKAVTSKEVEALLAPATGWKVATVKTLLRRLVQKGALAAERQGRAFVYRPQVGEQETINQAVEDLFASICQMRAGAALVDVVDQIPLSKQDITNLQAALNRRAATAPERVTCNCLPDETDCDCD